MLERFRSPADVKALDPDELPDLADELRTFVIEAVARTGGHLGSNLGAVELTIALHRVFDSPRDVLLWDTGHQAYVHKILTGRSGGFAQLRQAGGLSGYPSRDESEHDWIENSHASTALSYAFGLAAGRRDLPLEQRGHVVAVMGDGALTGGMAYEALNNLGTSGLPVTILLNDNGRSYAETVSRLSANVSTLRMDPRYRTWRQRLDALSAAIPFADRVRDASLAGIKQFVSDAPALQRFVEALGVRYVGPVDGHDVERVEWALRRTLDSSGPVLVHALTEKGKGYRPAEADPEKKLHDTGAFDPETGQVVPSSARKWTSWFADAMVDLADERDDIVAITAAMPGSTGLLPLAARYPDRVIDVGIAEQHAVTAAAGMAWAGKKPVFAVYSTFFSRAFDQANLDVGLHDAGVVFVFDRAGITGDDGASHHGVLDMALSLRIPTMAVLAPSSAEEVVVLLREAVELDGPATIRFPKGAAITGLGTGEGLAARQVRGPRPDGSRDVVVLSVGDRLEASLAAAETLATAEGGGDASVDASDGLHVEVWDVRSVRPLDPTMLDAVADAPFVVTVENGYVNGGAGAYVADRLVERTGVQAAPPVLRLGVPDGYIQHAKPDRILSELGLDADGIAAAIRKAVTDA